jgi:hypothetical protein
MDKPLEIKSDTRRLDRLSSVRAEMARIYRQVRAGKMEPESATKRVYILKEIRACIEAELGERLEERMVRVQEALSKRGL